MTPYEAIEIVIQDLENVCIPIVFIKQIGIPIARSIENLKLLLESYENNDNQKKDEVNEEQTNADA